ncbi:MAG: acetyl-CoA decarbonylase/synthase complex subunit gamma [Lentisphaerae bacterium RIFOXYB12_FULL_65_16]|nr:MAG: acetyl-CoA decarbonylase/synthase complex subunit gamma [Lentisphaerae bacterium RIFOXYA12_64_32]OGV91129.1 MAG: acetyl-CoA decarbonylase/synthase complex subunit gamma [Lentisphaerae bacterium RIFOXYB12_FULL_65_16]
MALKALDIFKLLPKTNCKKCGTPTCLAFAMKLAQKQAKLDDCPDVSAEAKALLAGAAAPPIRLVTVGTGDRKLEIGNETVMFRHDESFYHQAGIGVIVPDTLTGQELTERLAQVKALAFVRVGTRIGAGLVAVENASGRADTFVTAVQAARKVGLPLVLMAADAAVVKAALAAGCAAERPLIYAASEGNWEGMAQLAKEHNCPLAVTGADLDAVAALARKVRQAGAEELILDLGVGSLARNLEALTAARRLALKRKADGVGYPSMVCCRDADPAQNLIACCSYAAKYAGIVLTPLRAPEQILPMLTIGQNIYADPRKPIQVEAKVYSVGAVTPQSPLLVTTNFSLTYYTVESEVEASRVPAYIGVLDTEGTSVLTAFASDKLTAEKVVTLLRSEAVTKAVSHQKVIIPGYIAAMSGELLEASGWEIMVGPREASGIPKYLKTVWQGA